MPQTSLNCAETVFAQPTQGGYFRLGSVGRFFCSLLDSPLVWELAGWCLIRDGIQLVGWNDNSSLLHCLSRVPPGQLGMSAWPNRVVTVRKLKCNKQKVEVCMCFFFFFNLFSFDWRIIVHVILKSLFSSSLLTPLKPWQVIGLSVELESD